MGVEEGSLIMQGIVRGRIGTIRPFLGYGESTS